MVKLYWTGVAGLYRLAGLAGITGMFCLGSPTGLADQASLIQLAGFMFYLLAVISNCSEQLFT